jgi:hypothetical protein
MGRSQPNIVIDVQMLVTHAASVATMEGEMAPPPRLIRTSDVCNRFQARDEARLPDLVDRWTSYGIAGQVVQIPPTSGQSTYDSHLTLSSYQERPGRDTNTPTTGLIRKAGPSMRSTTDYIHEGRDQTAHSSTDAQVPDETMDTARDMGTSFEEIER